MKITLLQKKSLTLHLSIEYEKKTEVYSERCEVGTTYCFYCFQSGVKCNLNTNTNSA